MLRSTRLTLFNCKLVAATTCILVVSSQTAFANMRAPQHYIYPPSSVLYHSSKNLVVNTESLHINCANKNCAVKVKYEVEAKKTAPYKFSFILPAKVVIKVYKKDTWTRAKTSAMKPRNKKEEAFRHASFNRSRTRLHQASFNMKLKQGKNNIQIQYSQPMSGFEGAYGYFRKSRYFHQFRYEIWPLKQWRRSRDFKLNVSVKIRKVRSLWKSVRGRGFRAVCYALEYTPCHNRMCTRPGKTRARFNQTQGYLVSQFSFRGKLPDVLICQSGDRDLVKRR